MGDAGSVLFGCAAALLSWDNSTVRSTTIGERSTGVQIVEVSASGSSVLKGGDRRQGKYSAVPTQDPMEAKGLLGESAHSVVKGDNPLGRHMQYWPRSAADMSNVKAAADKP